jgi:spore maturation protein CgeB
VKEKALTVNWFCDDQWRFDDFSGPLCHHFSYVITTDPYAMAKYRDVGFSKAILSQWATLECREEFDGAPPAYAHDVSFVGLRSPFRRWLIKELGRRGVDVACFGHGWPRGRVTYDEMAATFLGSRINLNISNSRSHDLRYVFSGLSSLREYLSLRKVREQVKGRHFEINAMGGFQLTNYVDFLENYFRIGQEIGVYNALDDLVEKIRYYLEHEELRQGIARAGYERVRQEHSYEDRFREAFRVMGVAGDG